MKKNPDKIIMTFAEFLSGAQTSDLVVEDATEQGEDEKLKDSRARRDEEWGLLANQVVGGETAMFPKPECGPPSGGGLRAKGKQP